MSIELIKKILGDDDLSEFLKFERVEIKISKSPDLHAFILLSELVSLDDDIVGAAEHDQIWLNVDCEKLAAVVTEAQLIELSRCGIRYDSESDSLCMFV